MDLRRIHDLLKRVLVSELTVRIIDAVTMIFLSDLREVLWPGTVSLHMLKTSISKQRRRNWALGFATQLSGLLSEWSYRISAIGEELFK